jgi:hypothetical protein
MELSQARDELVEYVRRNLIGPRDGAQEILQERPDDVYTTAVLHPQEPETNFLIEEQGDEESTPSAEMDLIDHVVRLTNERAASSAALTFLVSGDKPEITVRSNAAVYTRQQEGWAREELPEEQVRVNSQNTRSAIWNDRAHIVCKWRRTDAGHLVTIAIVNNIQIKPTASRAERSASCLFQAVVSCQAVDGQICHYQSHGDLPLGDEEAELLLRYSHLKTYAIGHGCAAQWSETNGATTVNTAFLPFIEVPQLVATAGDQDVLRLNTLSEATPESLATSLGLFVDGYSEWLSELRSQPIPPNKLLRAARDRILQRVEIALERMREGVAAMSDPLTRQVFQLSQKAMIRQMEHSDQSLGGRIRDLQSAPDMPDERVYLESDAAWRPFQLGFILTCIKSVIDPRDYHRDTVDLIWAATGSGKTEAYLALAAAAIIHRRLEHGEHGGGTAVLTRYTLRLLTAQQFERTSRLACALELLRRNFDELGTEAFTVGLWVGETSTPNDFKTAEEMIQALEAGKPPSPGIQLEKCPWCGVRILPRHSGGQDNLGVKATDSSFKIYCPSERCDFHDALPVQVVDEALYQSPPTLLIGTVDKFARLAWMEEPGIFFGDKDQLPPSLIIQDELHLLSGPLGTTVGLYEAVIETLCELNGTPPKVLAATATIREAPSQIKALYGKNSVLFPPAGLDERDSYFTQVDDTKKGRGYLGVLSPNHTPSTSLVRTCAVLLQGAKDVPMEPGERNAYWTLVAYHNSLRELGRTRTFARDDIPARLEVIAGHGEARPLDQDDVLELTGSVHSSEIPENLGRLAIPFDEPEAVSFAVCTNMLSVGVDVQRLGLMVIHGQPKTTAEYIQASSRVGRSDIPGLVIAHYSSTKPRDRSHYEQFSSYHRALYRWVEPTSVTPFSLPARKRSLAAALVILVRHGLGLSLNSQAHEFDPENPDLARCIDLFLKRVERADSDESDDTRAHIKRLATRWGEEIELCDREQKRLYFRLFGRAQLGVSLIGQLDWSQRIWAAPNNMRSLDSECQIDLISEYDYVS